MEMTSLRSLKKSMVNELKTVEAEQPEYPYGLTIDLDNDTIKKMGLDVTKFSVEDEIQIVAKAFISRVSSEKTGEGSNDSLCIQLTDMIIIPVEKEQQARLRDAMKMIM